MRRDLKFRKRDAALVAAGDETALLRRREFEWHFRFTVLAGPAYQLWLRVLVNGERKPELMREAIRLGEEAQSYKTEMMQKHPGEIFKGGAWQARSLQKDGDWYRLLEQLEKEAAER
jgi:hypothetical protein